MVDTTKFRIDLECYIGHVLQLTSLFTDLCTLGARGRDPELDIANMSDGVVDSLVAVRKDNQEETCALRGL